MDQNPAICFACSRLWKAPDPSTGAQMIVYCDAFPGGKGIPAPIATGRFDHRKPFGGEHDGLLFKQAPGEYAQSKLGTWEQFHKLASAEEE